MNDPVEFNEGAVAGSSPVPCSPAPKFFAGSYCTEEDVSGGTGETPDEAVDDYFNNYADDEIDYYTDLNDESGTFTVEVFEVYESNPEEDEDNTGDWKWMCGKCVEKHVFSWRIEPDPEWEGLNKIIYEPIEENTEAWQSATEK